MVSMRLIDIFDRDDDDNLVILGIGVIRDDSGQEIGRADVVMSEAAFYDMFGEVVYETVPLTEAEYGQLRDRSTDAWRGYWEQLRSQGRI